MFPTHLLPSTVADTFPQAGLRSLARVVPLAALLLGCDPGIEGSGFVESRSAELSRFDSISIEDGFTVRLVPSDEFGVVVHADDNVIDEVDVDQKGTQVRVHLPDVHVGHATLEVDVLVPELKALRLIDGSRFEAEDLPTTGSLKLEVGDGSHLELTTMESEQLAYLELRCEDGSYCAVAAHSKESIVEIHDGSSARLQGTSDSMTLLVSDAGRLSAKDYRVGRLNVRIDDSSSASIFVQDFAQGKVTDSSRLELGGDPETALSSDDSSQIVR